MSTKRAFTLIETVLYVAILGMIAGSLILFSISMSTARAKDAVIEEVNTGARNSLGIISSKIRQATAVTVPLPGASNTVLGLDMPAPTPDVVILPLNGVLNYIDSAVGAQQMTSNNVRVKNILFQNVASAGERDALKITLTLQVNASSSPEFNYEQTVSTTVMTHL